MSDTKLKDFQVDGVTIPIMVRESGEFWCRLDGELSSANSLKTLTEKIKRHVRTSRKIAVPITLLDDFGPQDDKVKIQQVTLTGIHGGSGNVIAVDDKTKTQQQLRYFYGMAVRRLTGEEIQQFVALVKASRDARVRVEEWIEARSVEPRKLVEQAAAALDPALDQNTEVTG